ncbi:MAG: shikimate dehydrogenase [Burkholderiaceae bacterium]
MRGVAGLAVTGEDIARYAVVGNPVAHSLSPEIHAAFAKQTGEPIDYTRMLAPLDGFVTTIERFFDGGGMGLNVTVPFKLGAFAYCGDRISARARRAGAVNVLARRDEKILDKFDGAVDGAIDGDNTDGVGLVRDLERLVGTQNNALANARVLLVGAGGATRGAIGPLLATRPAMLTIVNRDVSKARALVQAFSATNEHGARFQAQAFDALDSTRYDVIINATSASLANASLPLPPDIFVGATLAYDMMYSATATPFMDFAARSGAVAVADGLGMLVEQAAESFFIWRGVRPGTGPVLAELRELLSTSITAKPQA